MRADILNTFDSFVKGYRDRDVSSIDSFMDLFSDNDDIQMIGIGATKPGEYEWFTGKEEIREIILSDWQLWGAVHFDMKNIRISERNDTAWFSLCAELEQLEPDEDAWKFYLTQMKKLLDDQSVSSHDRMFEAAHFGLRRVREKNLGVGYRFKMVITGVLVKEELWKFHTLHWSMPVD
jgi:hypothetical protein